MKTRTITRLLSLLMVVLMAFSALPAATVSFASAKAAATTAAAAKVKLSKCTFTYEKGVVYTGKARKPALTVTYKGKTLTNGTDYTVAYKNNKAIGIATMTVTAKAGGSFTGSKTLKFVIRPAKVKGLTSSKQTTAAIKLSWTAVKGATGYRVYFYDAKTKTYSKAKNVTATSAVIKNLKAGTVYRFVVRAYAVAEKKVYWGVNSALLKVKTKAQTVTPVDPQPVDPQPVDPQKLATVTSLKAKKNGTTVTLTWNAVPNVNTYHVCTYDAATKKYTTLTKTTTNQAKITNFEIEKTCTVAVRAYAEGSDGTVYGDFSAPISVTVYYADKYSALFKSGAFQITFKTNMEGMTDPVTVATKNGNLYMSTKMAVSDSSKVAVKILYLKKTNKTYLYMSGMWFDATSAMEGDSSMMDIAGIFSELDFGNTDNVQLSTEKIGSTTYKVETVIENPYDMTKLYLKDDGTLVRIVTVENGKTTMIMNISALTDQVNDKLFKKPTFAVDLSALG